MDWSTGAPRHLLYGRCDQETSFLLQMRTNICYYANILDTYAPCIVKNARWNNDANMEEYCTTTDRPTWDRNILTISDEAFLLSCLINYGKRWFAECNRQKKKVRRQLRISSSINPVSISLNEVTDNFCKNNVGKGEWTEEDEKNMPVSCHNCSSSCCF